MKKNKILLGLSLIVFLIITTSVVFIIRNDSKKLDTEDVDALDLAELYEIAEQRNSDSIFESHEIPEKVLTESELNARRDKAIQEAENLLDQPDEVNAPLMADSLSSKRMPLVIYVEEKAEQGEPNIRNILTETVNRSNRQFEEVGILRELYIERFESYDNSTKTNCKLRSGVYRPSEFCYHPPTYIVVAADWEIPNSAFFWKYSFGHSPRTGTNWDHPYTRNVFTHEAGHILGLPDQYWSKIKSQHNEINGERYYPFSGYLMHDTFNEDNTFHPVWDTKIVNKIDTPFVEGGVWATWMTYIPNENAIHVTGKSYCSVGNANVKIYRSTVEDEGQIAKIINPPTQTGNTDSYGKMNLNDSLVHFSDQFNFYTPRVFLVEVEKGGVKDYDWFNTYDINRTFWSGDHDSGSYSIETDIDCTGNSLGPTGNRISNHSFESGLNNWVRSGDIKPEGIIVDCAQWNSCGGVDGAKFLKLVKENDGIGSYDPYLVSDWYDVGFDLSEISFDVKFDVKSHVNNDELFFQLQRYPFDGDWEGTGINSESIPINYAWKRVEKRMTFSDLKNGNAGSKFRLVLRALDHQPVYYDNVFVGLSPSNASYTPTPLPAHTNTPIPTNIPIPTSTPIQTNTPIATRTPVPTEIVFPTLIPNTCQCDLWAVVDENCNTGNDPVCTGKFDCQCQTGTTDVTSTPTPLPSPIQSPTPTVTPTVEPATDIECFKVALDKFGEEVENVNSGDTFTYEIEFSRPVEGWAKVVDTLPVGIEFIPTTGSCIVGSIENTVLGESTTNSSFIDDESKDANRTRVYISIGLFLIGTVVIAIALTVNSKESNEEKITFGSIRLSKNSAVGVSTGIVMVSISVFMISVNSYNQDIAPKDVAAADPTRTVSCVLQRGEDKVEIDVKVKDDAQEGSITNRVSFEETIGTVIDFGSCQNTINIGDIPLVTPTLDPSVTPTITPTNDPSITPTVTPTVTPTIEPSAIPTTEPTICGPIDVNENGDLEIVDFGAFAQLYGTGNTPCSDVGVDYGECGGKDTNDDGKIGITDFGGQQGLSFASRYNTVDDQGNPTCLPYN